MISNYYYIIESELIDIIHKHWYDPSLFLGYKDTELLLKPFTQTTATATGFEKPEDAYGLTDHASPVSSALAYDYIEQDKKVLSGKKLHILDVLPTVKGKVLCFTIRIPVIDERLKIVGSAFHSVPIENNKILTPLGNLITLDNKNGGTFILNEENLLLNTAINPDALTQKEQEILWLLARGLSARKISEVLDRSLRTIECHIENIKEKYQCQNKFELVEKAIHQGILSYLPVGLVNKKIVDIFYTK